MLKRILLGSCSSILQKRDRKRRIVLKQNTVTTYNVRPYDIILSFIVCKSVPIFLTLAVNVPYSNLSICNSKIYLPYLEQHTSKSRQ